MPNWIPFQVGTGPPIYTWATQCPVWGLTLTTLQSSHLPTVLTYQLSLTNKLDLMSVILFLMTVSLIDFSYLTSLNYVLIIHLLGEYDLHIFTSTAISPNLVVTGLRLGGSS